MALLDLVRDISCPYYRHIFYQQFVAKDKGNKGMMKSSGKRKGEMKRIQSKFNKV